MFRIKSSFLTLFVVLGVSLLVTGLASAQTDFVGLEDTRFLGAELGSAAQEWKVPLGSSIARSMSFIPDTNSFFLDLVLGNGATWVDAAGNVTVTVDALDATVADKVGAGLAQLLSTTNITNDTIRITWDSGALPVTTFSSARLVFDNLSFDDNSNQAGAEANISVGVFTFTTFPINPLDVGSNTIADYFSGDAFFNNPTVTSDAAVVDVETNRTTFVATAPDTTTEDRGANVTLSFSGNAPFDIDGTVFSADNGKLTQIVGLFSDGTGLTGITLFEAANWNGAPSAPDRITITTAFAAAAAANNITITVAGDEVLDSRQVRVAFTFTVAGTDFARGSNILVSTWTLNGCVLVAHWLNGNTDAPGVPGVGIFKSRMYITNHTSNTGAVNVRIEQADRTGDATQDSADLGTTADGALPDLTGTGALVIKLEDVLDALGVAMPHTVAGGNLSAVVTVRVSSCSGSYQTFDETVNAAFFGTASMELIE